MQDKIVINDYIENDPLSDENLDKTLETIHEIRLSFQINLSGFIADIHGKSVNHLVKKDY